MAGRQEFSGSVVLTNGAVFLSAANAYNLITIDAAVSEVKAGAARLPNRNVLSLQADTNNSGEIYVGLDNTVTAAKYAMKLTAGATAEIVIDPKSSLAIFAIGSAAGQKLAVIEGASS